jgi:uncharacterized Fe-S center protein
MKGKSRVFLAPAEGKEGAESLSAKIRNACLATGFNDRIADDDFVAMKIHFGEKNNTGYIKPRWLKGIVSELRKRTSRAFLTDSNTLYVGKRSNSIDHIQLAWSHGFTPDVLEVPVIIADGLIGRDDRDIAAGRSRVRSAKIAGAILDADALLCLTHVTGHVQTGIGASIKNMGMGCASRAGKLDQHSVVHPRVSAKACRNCGICFDHCPEAAIVQAEGHVVIDGEKCVGCGACLVVCKPGAIKWRWDEDSPRIQEKIAEYALTVQNRFKGKVAFINVLIHVTKECDCMAKSQPPIVEDIGIVASSDPVAADKATADLILARAGKDVFRKGYDLDWAVQLRHGERIGLGSMDYALTTLD